MSNQQVNQEQPASERRNARRRDMYSTDSEYRKNIRKQNRVRYRARSGAEPEKDCSQNLGELGSIGAYRELEGMDEGDTVFCFTVAETAEALDGYSEQAIYRWLREGQLPPMVYRARVLLPVNSGGTREAFVSVYTIDEVKAIIGALADHQRDYQYYTKRHTETKLKIYSAVSNARD